MFIVDVRQAARYALVALGLMSIAILAVACWSGAALYLGDDKERTALLSLVITGAAGLALSIGTRSLTRSSSVHLGRREAILMVVMSWVFGAALAGTVYFVWAWLASARYSDHPFLSPVNCYFEAISGLTTTGSTVLPDIDALPRSLQLWRSTTHWIGGLGIVLLFAALLPSLGITAKKLARAESAGSLGEDGMPSIRKAAQALWIAYVAITLAGTVALCLAGMGLFDSVNHAFAALATGGFSTQDASVGHYRSLAVDVIIISLMVLGGVNFALYYRLFQGHVRQVARDTELRFYAMLLLISSTLAVLALSGKPIPLTTGETLPPSLASSMRYGVFNIVSLHTDTGFATADFNRWPDLAKVVLLVGTLIGGSTASTTGGIKAARLFLMFRIMLAHTNRYLSPKRVEPVRIGKTVVDSDTQERILCHVLLFILVLLAGTVLLMLLEPEGRIDLVTAGTASLATLCTAGPGLAKVGPIENYLWFTDASKLVMCLLMILGRLELFTFFAVLTPRFWRAD